MAVRGIVERSNYIVAACRGSARHQCERASIKGRCIDCCMHSAVCDGAAEKETGNHTDGAFT